MKKYRGGTCSGLGEHNELLAERECLCHRLPKAPLGKHPGLSLIEYQYLLPAFASIDLGGHCYLQYKLGVLLLFVSEHESAGGDQGEPAASPPGPQCGYSLVQPT